MISSYLINKKINSQIKYIFIEPLIITIVLYRYLAKAYILSITFAGTIPESISGL